ncbi:aspartyl asparaginyl beta-hydroxylase family protein [Stylonychia lemnae]|uniref:Aspartyl asparaginyl beta-hydroxylase family protein n=1 Tax=Stylonychia lemnae TaxID=5949 RepID=A0A077ZQA1_STYLE|nr:aspartyl asparaginyl beta-hydroxylase family protein [Stylonychia lemnae]|eukprot:CDW71634.1 aspartyl asparaginyl beta-hydroxylase family protein [Stylonychia lemnae]
MLIRQSVQQFRKINDFDHFERVINYHQLNDTGRQFVEKFILEKIGDLDNKNARVAREWLRWQIDDDYIFYAQDDQVNCAVMTPVLRAKKFWDKKEFDWVDEFVSYQDVFIKEMESLYNQQKFSKNGLYVEFLPNGTQVERNIGIEYQGAWNVFQFLTRGYQDDTAQLLVPETVKILRSKVKRFREHATYSYTTPNSHIEAHNGEDNKRLRVILPLIGTEGSRMRVSDEWVYHQAGNLFIFDDSFEHEVWNEGNSTRLILIIDIWHPDLSDEEIQFYDVLEKESYKMGLIQRYYDKGIDLDEQERIISELATNMTEPTAEYEQNILTSDKTVYSDTANADSCKQNEIDKLQDL